MSVSSYASLASSHALLTFTYPYPHSRDEKDKKDQALYILGDI